jgi:uncharacterized delta-60 repeat protein
MPRLAARGAALAVAAVLAAGPAAALAAPGDLDAGFGTGGVAATPGVVGNAVELQPDGKIVVAGVAPSSRFVVARFRPDGQPDTGFGQNGVAGTTFGTVVQAAYDLAIQPDGRIVAVGTAGEDFGRRRSFALARFNADGTLDSSFGGDGKVTSDVGAATINDATGVALQADGKIVVGGYAAGAAAGSFAVARYDADGSLDVTFGGNGVVTTDLGGGGANDVAIAQRQRIVAVGSTYAPGGSSDFALARYLPGGAFDDDFGVAGRLFTDLGAQDAPTAIAIDKGGRVTAVGSTSHSGGPVDIGVVRYGRDGRLDRSFGGDGVVTTSFGSEFQIAYDVALDGAKTVVAGYAFRAHSDDIALVRYEHNGQLDARFGIGGRVITDLGAFNTQARGLAIQPDGGIVAVANGALLRYAGR